MTKLLADLVEQAQCLVFDFDGTLVDSNPIKERAFEKLFEEFRHKQEEILAYCRGFHHTPRGEKFRHVYEKILGLPYTPHIEAALHNRFEALTTRQIVEAPAVPGAELFVRDACRRRLTAVLSSTPHEVLVQILKERRWLDYFKGVRGAPVDKAAWLRLSQEENGWEGAKIIFFGDTPEDLQAAAQAGCTFVAVHNESLGSEAAYSLCDFTQLLPSSLAFDTGH